VKTKAASHPEKEMTLIYERIKEILELARASVARTVNTTQVTANWLIGREIVEEEQQGERRAGYGEQLLEDLSIKLTREYGSGFSVQNLRLFRQFYQTYPLLIIGSKIRYALSSESEPIDRKNEKEKGHALSGESWEAGELNPNLSWTHYRTLLRVEKPEARAFYEIETIRNNWKTRELERQINSLLYERLALSKDRKGLMRLATKGQEIQKPADVFKDPLAMEFLGLPVSPKLVESDLEQALINSLQTFLLEQGRGFAFVSRQERITLDGDHFYIDLVFYHTILKCYVVIDLKVGKLNHQDLGQLQLYVNYYDQERRAEGDNPTLGLILCTDKNDAVVRYTLGPAQQKKIFASRYKLYLPTEAELKAELRRELRLLSNHSKKEGNA
jgi:predicted nuclease of restriction endonuclease-like (RecB) superfamily